MNCHSSTDSIIDAHRSIRLITAGIRSARQLLTPRLAPPDCAEFGAGAVALIRRVPRPSGAARCARGRPCRCVLKVAGPALLTCIEPGVKVCGFGADVLLYGVSGCG
jgi:hypothetical protein